MKGGTTELKLNWLITELKTERIKLLIMVLKTHQIAAIKTWLKLVFKPPTLQRTSCHAVAATVLLALLIRCLLPIPAYGAVGPVEETTIRFPAEEESHEVETEIRGTIEVSLISAALPSDVEFSINPNGSFDAVLNPGGQIQSPSPTEFKIINNSVVPVRLEIAEVGEIRPGDLAFTESYPGGPPQNFRLVDQVSKVNAYGTAILVLGPAGKTYHSDADFEQYAICPGRRDILVADLEAEEEAGLQIYGKAAADFYGGYQFTVRPVLKISAVRAR